MKFLLLLLLTSTSLLCVDYNEIYGHWKILSLKDNNRKVFFAGEYKKDINLLFQTNAKVEIDGVSKYYFQLLNENLLIGKWIKDGKIRGNHDVYRFVSLVSPELSYGKTCYILSPIKLGMGGIKSKNKMKICRDKKDILEKYRY